MRGALRSVCLALVCLAPMCLALGACAAPGPSYERPDLAAWTEPPFARGGGGEGRTDPAGWWRRLGDPVLEELVEEALASNTDLAVAAANLRGARAFLESQHGARLPSAELALAAGRTRVEGADGSRMYTTLLEPGLAVRWQADLFGRLRSAEAAAVADEFAAAEDRRALQHSIIGEVVRVRVRLATTARRLGLAQAIVTSRGLTLDSVGRRYRAGAEGSGAIDVALANENSDAAEADVIARTQELEQLSLVLDVLLGRKPGTTRADRRPMLAPLPPAPTPTLGVPAELLDARPDLRASELRTIAATERVGIALADLYPDFVLTGRVWRDAEDLGDLFSLDGLIASLTGNLVQKLFEGGRLTAEVEVAKARVEAATARYAGDVLAALHEVEDALVREQRVGERLEKVRSQSANARAAERLARARYGGGLGSLLTVLETERRSAAADDLVAWLEGEAWSARIDLVLALGGEWLPMESKTDAR